MTIAAPVVVREMEDWVALGGRNLGIVGDANHNRGFHLGANEVLPEDYSRRRDPNGSDGPYVNWRYACAGDFAHDFKPELLTETRRVLNNIRLGRYPEICEFIGKPWTDRPVIYTAVWNGWRLQNYTGSGHDRWSHISWFRSRVNIQSNLWGPKVSAKENWQYGIVNPVSGTTMTAEQRLLDVETKVSISVRNQERIIELLQNLSVAGGITREEVATMIANTGHTHGMGK